MAKNHIKETFTLSRNCLDLGKQKYFVSYGISNVLQTYVTLLDPLSCTLNEYTTQKTMVESP